MTRVLVVEDNRLNQKLVLTILRVNGFEVEAADSAEDALDLLERSRPDVILTDIQMPGMDGVEFARIVKSREDLKGIPVVALTAYAMRGDRERFLSQGLDGYIAKPIDAKTLPAIVRDYAARNGA